MSKKQNNKPTMVVEEVEQTKPDYDRLFSLLQKELSELKYSTSKLQYGQFIQQAIENVRAQI